MVVTTKNRNKTITEEWKTKHSPIKPNIPIFILVNNYTASAAEILAGALKAHANKQSKPEGKSSLKVFIVGTKTFGKGSVQDVIPLTPSCAIKITTGLYYLPDNTTVQGTGIIPDFEVEALMPPPEEFRWITNMYGRESALKGHILTDENKKTKGRVDKSSPSNKDKSIKEKKLERLSEDNQLQCAINLANTLSRSQSINPSLCCNRESGLKFLKNNIVCGKLNGAECIDL